MTDIAFYLMNSKGYFVFKKFIETFDPKKIKYVMSSRDNNIKKDYFEEIMDICRDNNIPFYDKRERKYIEVEKKFDGYKFAIGWRWMIENNNNLIVFHDSLLPKYRGFAPLVNALINGDKVVGVTALYANDEYDKGDIILQKSLKIKYPIKVHTVIDQIAPLYFNLLSDIYNKIQNNFILNRKKQNENKASYSLWLDEEDYFIDWNWSAQKLARFVDAVGYPFDYAKTYLNGEIIKCIDVEVVNDVKIKNRKRHIGKVIFIIDNIPVVVCKKGLLKLKDIRDVNDKKVTIKFRSRFK